MTGLIQCAQIYFIVIAGYGISDWTNSMFTDFTLLLLEDKVLVTGLIQCSQFYFIVIAG